MASEPDKQDRGFAAAQNLYHHASVSKDRAESAAAAIRDYTKTREELLELGVSQAVSPTTPSSLLVKQPFEELAELVAKALRTSENNSPPVNCGCCDENEVADYTEIASSAGITESSWLPDYLFRVHSTSSYGHNTPHCFRSRISSQHCDHASFIAQLKQELAARSFSNIVRIHLEWLTYSFRSPFVSTTASLLFALQMAIRENADGRKKATKVSIAIIETCKLSKSQAHAAPDLITATAPTSTLDPRNYKEEYLVLERIPPSAVIGNCTLESLVNLGLSSFVPWLFIKSLESKLRSAVISHRNFVEPPRPILVLEAEKALSFARVFRTKNHDTAMRCLAVMFLCLSARERIPEVAPGRERLLTFSLELGASMFGVLDVRPPGKALEIPELERFYEMVKVLNEACREAGAVRQPTAREGLKRSFSESSVGGLAGSSWPSNKARRLTWKTGGVEYPKLPE